MKKISLPENISSYLLNQTSIGKEIVSVSSIAGGDIYPAFRVKTVTGSFFIKINDANEVDAFKKEAHSLKALSTHSNFRIPKTLLFDTIDCYSFLALEFIEENRTVKATHSLTGKYLADLHKASNKFFGFDENNYTGNLPQSNTKHSRWVEFFALERIEPQFKKAFDNGDFDSTYSKKTGFNFKLIR